MSPGETEVEQIAGIMNSIKLGTRNSNSPHYT